MLMKSLVMDDYILIFDALKPFDCKKVQTLVFSMFENNFSNIKPKKYTKLLKSNHFKKSSPGERRTVT